MLLPPLNTLHAFQVAARLSNISRAGEELHVTHAAVSSQIKRLESWFGRKLFQRAGRGIVLTPAGREFQQAVDAALAEISRSSQKLRRGHEKKAISVACIPSIATRWLVPALPDFMRKHADIPVQVSYAHALEEFDPERYDVLITYLRITTAGLLSAKLFSRVNKPVASPGYLQRKPDLLDNGLDGARLLHDQTTDAWQDWFNKAGFRPKTLSNGPVYEDFNLLATAVIAGHGIALCPIEVFRREIVQGDLVILSNISTQENDAYYLVSSSEQNRAVTTFTKWFVGTCSPKTLLSDPSQANSNRTTSPL
ncbi:LysR substrate-binding domain-containing protein [Mesorhizobium sp. B2-4-6]|uniref:LysR substrate-binding domain-containing protein n=1 Tax=Mesorhizobium sp. B2-4-6 TaxID=2589943 RepID=UPI00112CE378|nr:LysR substrate-binding domain-containing protein [Mesorhizobium sp. B2-4-6]TPL43524.1 LysR family transcriptional regulator [Mesorhizobium sp. B2-4-6]